MNLTINQLMQISRMGTLAVIIIGLIGRSTTLFKNASVALMFFIFTALILVASTIAAVQLYSKYPDAKGKGWFIVNALFCCLYLYRMLAYLQYI